MKKLYLLLGMVCAGLLAMPQAANASVEETEKAAAIVREGSEELKFLKKPFFLAETYYTQGAYVNDYALNGAQDPEIWISIKKYPNGEQAPSFEKYVPPAQNGHRSQEPSHDPAVTRDLRHPEDQVLSVFYEPEDGEPGMYVVKRKIQAEDDVFVLEVVIRNEDSANVDVQRKALFAVRNTSLETMTDFFVELKTACKFGADCRFN